MKSEYISRKLSESEGRHLFEILMHEPNKHPQVDSLIKLFENYSKECPETSKSDSEDGYYEMKPDSSDKFNPYMADMLNDKQIAEMVNRMTGESDEKDFRIDLLKGIVEEFPEEAVSCLMEDVDFEESVENYPIKVTVLSPCGVNHSKDAEFNFKRIDFEYDSKTKNNYNVHPRIPQALVIQNKPRYFHKINVTNIDVESIADVET